MPVDGLRGAAVVMAMSLSNPDARRGLRAIIAAIVSLALVAFVWWFAPLITDSHDLLTLLLAALAIVGIGVLLYGAENVTRAVKFHAGLDGVEGSIGDDENNPE